MRILQVSPPAPITNGPPCLDPIHLFLQFFIHKDPKRHQEIQLCLQANVGNPAINKIHLLGERLYTLEELGIQSEKIVQTVIDRRLKFQDVFAYIRKNDIKGYHALVNADICFDETLPHIFTTTMHEERLAFAQLRFEYNSLNPCLSKLFGPRFDSQDTWIFHSNFPLPKKAEPAFNFEFGKPGCDNKMIYLMNVLGYKVINDPFFIKTYHIHSSIERDYTIKDVVTPPWGLIVPAYADPKLITPSVGIDPQVFSEYTNSFNECRFDDNALLYGFIDNRLNFEKKPFCIPRITGVMSYIKMEQEAFSNSDIFSCYCPGDVELQPIVKINEEIRERYSVTRKIIWSAVFDIFHYIYSCPWTTALKGKRVLIISLPIYSQNITRQRIQNRKNVYGIDLFPNCTIDIMEISTFSNCKNDYSKINTKMKEYDVALVSCDECSNAICSSIYENGKSALHLGDVLPMYFGVYSKNWLTRRPDIIRIFLNEHWHKEAHISKDASIKLY